MDQAYRNQAMLTEQETEIESSSPNIDAIMAEIRGRAQSHREGSAYQPDEFPDLEEMTCPTEPSDDQHSPLLYFHLRQVNQSFIVFQIGLDLRPSGLDRLPVIGPVWDNLRRHLHSLSVFYVNKVAEPLISFNRHIVTILNIMTHQAQKRDAELADLKRRIAELEARLADVEEKS
jgi:hypothetical protein